MVNENFVRLTPDRQSKRGAVWNTEILSWRNWEIFIRFNVNGVSQVRDSVICFFREFVSDASGRWGRTALRFGFVKKSTSLETSLGHRKRFEVSCFFSHDHLL